MHRVSFVTDVLNERSQAAIAKLGAVREGVCRSHMITQGGRVRDGALFSIVAAEWPRVKQNLVARLAGRRAGIFHECTLSGEDAAASPGTLREKQKQMAIRPFEETDAESVMTLWTTVFAYSAAHNNPATVIRNKLAVQRDLFFVALVGGVLAGTVMGGYDGHRGWIYSLAVDPQNRRRGVGSALMRHIERELAVRGCPKINLQVLASNAGTVEFYQKLGYAVEDRVSMGRLLTLHSGK